MLAGFLGAPALIRAQSNSVDYGNYPIDLLEQIQELLSQGKLRGKCLGPNHLLIEAVSDKGVHTTVYDGPSGDCDKYTNWRPYTNSEAFTIILQRAKQIKGIIGKANDPALSSTAPAIGRPALLAPLPLGPNLTEAALNMVDPGCTAALQPTFYVANHFDGTLTAIGGCPPALIKTISLSATRPMEAVLTPDATTVVVTHYDNAISFVDTATNTVTKTLATDSSIFPNGIAITPDGTRAYVGSYSDMNPNLFIVDLATRQVTGQIPMPYQFPESVNMTPDGSQIWVTFYQQDPIVIIDTLTNTIAATFYPTPQPHQIAFDSVGKRAFIAGAVNGEVAVINALTLDTLTRIPVGMFPTDVVITPDDKRVYVSVSGAGTVVTIDAVTYQIIESEESGVGSYGLTVFW